MLSLLYLSLAFCVYESAVLRVRSSIYYTSVFYFLYSCSGFCFFMFLNLICVVLTFSALLLDSCVFLTWYSYSGVFLLLFRSPLFLSAFRNNSSASLPSFGRRPDLCFFLLLFFVFLFDFASISRASAMTFRNVVMYLETVESRLICGIAIILFGPFPSGSFAAESLLSGLVRSC